MKLMIAMVPLLFIIMACNSSKERFRVKSRANNNSASTLEKLNNPYPVPPGYEKFTPAETGLFRQTDSFSMPKAANATYLESVDFNYVYKDSRNGTHLPQAGDVRLRITKYATEAQAKAQFQKGSSSLISVEKANQIKLPKCDPNKETDFTTPDELVKRLPHQNGSEITVIHGGRFFDYQCKVTSNRTERIYWVDGPYIFSLSSMPNSTKRDSTGWGIAEEFLPEYLKAIGQS